jgi:hypothetical protein
MEAWSLEMETWKVWKPVIVDFQYFDEDPDPDPHWSKKLDPDFYLSGKLNADPQHWIKRYLSKCL